MENGTLISEWENEQKCTSVLWDFALRLATPVENST